ncbi:hypothetical protein EJ110_NYTH16893 [Nymphaea thermarum]|nr:hypothetical protein EJ110_NYTH16893 [Nymphaea thermarum]
MVAALVSRIRGFGGKLFDNARERISLRCLEEILDSRSSNLGCDHSVSPISYLDRIGPSERCEDAFLRLSKAVHSTANSQKQLELLRHDVQQRRTYLGKPPLEKILEVVSDRENESQVSNRGDPTSTDGPRPSKRCKRTCVQLLKEFAAGSIPDARHDVSSETEELGPSERCQTFDVHDIQLLKENNDAPVSCAELDVPQTRVQSNQQDICHGDKARTRKAHFFESDTTPVMHKEDQLSHKEKRKALAPQSQKSVDDASTNDVSAHEVSHGNGIIPETSRSSGAFSDAIPVLSQRVGQNEGSHAGTSTLPSFGGPVDYASLTVGSEQGFCIKCNEGGNLLSCDSIGCPILVHDSCLGSCASFDNSGKFYCPYCLYRLAAAAYREAKEKVSLTRKALLSFMRADLTDRQPEEGPTHRVKAHSAQEAVANHVGCSDEDGEIKQQRADCLLPKVVRCSDGRSFCEGTENGDNDQFALNGKKETKCPEQTAGSLDDVDKTEENTVQSHEKASESPSSTLRVSRRRPAKRYANSMFPYLRRKKLPWTKEEEDALKEGVRKFSAVAGDGYPWTRILEYGRHVYHKTRTPIDLKDKWRNIQRRELPKQR